MRLLVEGLLADREIDPVKTREYLQWLAVENGRLTRVIDNFLTFARLERGQFRFMLEPASPAALLAGAVDAIRDRIPAGGDLRVEAEPDLPPVLADRDGITTALANLLDNAVKYSPERKLITVTARRDGQSVAFAVTDNGIGIPAREQRRIFRDFYRVDARLASPTTGVGLGLSIVDLIVRGHGGEVTVMSEPGAGSTFTFHLKAARGANRPPLEQTSGRQASGQPV